MSDSCNSVLHLIHSYDEHRSIRMIIASIARIFADRCHHRTIHNYIYRKIFNDQRLQKRLLKDSTCIQDDRPITNNLIKMNSTQSTNFIKLCMNIFCQQPTSINLSLSNRCSMTDSNRIYAYQYSFWTLTSVNSLFFWRINFLKKFIQVLLYLLSIFQCKRMQGNTLLFELFRQ